MKLAVKGAFLIVPAFASAERVSERLWLDAKGEAPMFDVVGTDRGDGLVMARQVLPDRMPRVLQVDGVNPAVLAQSRIIYLNKNGVTLAPGNNDARTNKSTIVNATTAIPAWNVTAANWQTVVTC